MPKPPGVMIASAWFVFCGILMGFVAMLVLIGSVVKVQNSKGMTGIFPNSVVGGMGIFVAILILLLAIAIVGLGVGLWRMRKWARFAALALMTITLPGSTSSLFNSLSPFHAESFFRAVILISCAVWMIWYLLQPKLKEAFGP